MAKAYALSAKAVREQKRINQIVRGGFRRRRPTERRPRFPGAVGGRASVDLVYAMFVQTVDAFTSIDGANITAEVGKAAAAAKILRYERDAEGVPIIPLVRVEQDTELDDQDQEIPKERTAINLSGSELRASVAEPIILLGRLTTVANEAAGTKEEVFEIPPIDPRQFTSYQQGEVQVLFHRVGQRGFELSGRDCDSG